MSDYLQRLRDEGHDDSCALMSEYIGWSQCTCNKRLHDKAIEKERRRGDLLGPLTERYGAEAVVDALGTMHLAHSLGVCACEDQAPRNDDADDFEDDRPSTLMRCGCPYCFCFEETEYGAACSMCRSGAHQG